uniref:Uncharacterized protein n=1 Tax=Anguilla anguilla TaxID=7936 RepID=A0A0E9V6X9_ANGAN
MCIDKVKQLDKGPGQKQQACTYRGSP